MIPAGVGGNRHLGVSPLYEEGRTMCLQGSHQLANANCESGARTGGKGGIEPPTQGFSVFDSVRLENS